MATMGRQSATSHLPRPDMKPMEAQTKIKLQRFRLQRLLAGEGERQRECERTVGLGITRRNSMSMESGIVSDRGCGLGLHHSGIFSGIESVLVLRARAKDRLAGSAAIRPSGGRPVLTEPPPPAFAVSRAGRSLKLPLLISPALGPQQRRQLYRVSRSSPRVVRCSLRLPWAHCQSK